MVVQSVTVAQLSCFTYTSIEEVQSKHSVVLQTHLHVGQELGPNRHSDTLAPIAVQELAIWLGFKPHLTCYLMTTNQV